MEIKQTTGICSGGITSVTITASTKSNSIEKIYLGDYIAFKGCFYRLAEWLTISKYAELKKVKVNTVCNWIKRGKIDKDNIVVIYEFNNLTLIRK